MTAMAVETATCAPQAVRPKRDPNRHERHSGNHTPGGRLRSAPAQRPPPPREDHPNAAGELEGEAGVQTKLDDVERLPFDEAQERERCWKLDNLRNRQAPGVRA